MPKDNSSTFIALIIGGGALAALAFATSKPPIPVEIVPVSKRVATELRARALDDAFGSSGAWGWVELNTTQRNWTVDPPNNANGNIQTNNIVFDDDSTMQLRVDSAGKIEFIAKDNSGITLDSWTQDGFAPTTGSIPINVLTAELAGTDLKVGHKNADVWIVNTYAVEINSRITSSRDGLTATYVTYNYIFKDGSKLDVEVVNTVISGSTSAIGAYTFTAVGPLGNTIMIWTENNYTPYVNVNLQSSKLYIQIFNAYNAFMLTVPSARNIVGEWEDTMGRAGGATTEQFTNGVAYKSHQYDIITYTTIIPSEPEVAADLIYDRNSTAANMYFYIQIRSTVASILIKTHDTFPDPTPPYDRTKTTAWGVITDTITAYMQAEKRFLTADDIISYWDQHAGAATGIIGTGLLPNEFYFSDGSSAALTPWVEIPRQFRIMMSFKDSMGNYKDRNYEAFLTDYWHASPPYLPLYGRNAKPHDWLASYLRTADSTQNTTPPSKQIHPYDGFATRQILTVTNLADFINIYGGNVIKIYNTYFTYLKQVAFDHGELDVASSLGYGVHYARFRDTSTTYMVFVKYERFGNNTGEKFKIQILNLSNARFDSQGRERTGIADYWAFIQARAMTPTIFYTSPGWIN